MDSIFSGLYVEDEALSAFAANNARLAEPSPGGGAGREAAALRRDLAAIRRCREALGCRFEGAENIPAACEWLLDNWYLAQREGAAAFAALRRASGLRRSGAEPLLFRLCRSLLSAGQGELGAARCTAYLRGYQSVLPLRRCELLLFPAAMRAVILSAMAELCAVLPPAGDEAAAGRAMEALFSSLRFLAGTDETLLLRAADLSDEILCLDPDGTYPRMDDESRAAYLDRLAELARAQDVPEPQLARALIDEAERRGGHALRQI